MAPFVASATSAGAPKQPYLFQLPRNVLLQSRLVQKREDPHSKACPESPAGAWSYARVANVTDKLASLDSPRKLGRPTPTVPVASTGPRLSLVKPAAVSAATDGGSHDSAAVLAHGPEVSSITTRLPQQLLVRSSSVPRSSSRPRNSNLRSMKFGLADVVCSPQPVSPHSQWRRTASPGAYRGMSLAAPPASSATKNLHTTRSASSLPLTPVWAVLRQSVGSRRDTLSCSGVLTSVAVADGVSPSDSSKQSPRLLFRQATPADPSSATWRFGVAENQQSTSKPVDFASRGSIPVMNTGVAQGVAHALRASLKPQLPGPLLQPRLDTHSTESIEQMELDLPRTYPEDSRVAARLGMVRSIMLRHMMDDAEVGYCQGLNCVAAVFALAAHGYDEAYARFWMFTRQVRGLWLPGFPLFRDGEAWFESAAASRPWHQHLEAKNVEPSMYLPQAWMTLFSSWLPLSILLQCVGLLESDGFNAIMAITLAVLDNVQDELMETKNMTQVMRILGDLRDRAPLAFDLISAARACLLHFSVQTGAARCFAANPPPRGVPCAIGLARASQGSQTARLANERTSSAYQSTGPLLRHAVSPPMATRPAVSTLAQPFFQAWQTRDTSPAAAMQRTASDVGKTSSQHVRMAWQQPTGGSVPTPQVAFGVQHGAMMIAAPPTRLIPTGGQPMLPNGVRTPVAPGEIRL